MRDANEDSLTDYVITRLAGAKSVRIKQVSEALVRHLHAFVREVELTEAEWLSGIHFLTRAGQLCDETRQEFILLSDALGVSMLVDAINHRLPDGATATTVLGPFYVSNPRTFMQGANIAADREGMPLLVTGSVSGVGGDPIPNAIVDVWHSDAHGFYDVQ